jgi:hypothetical protein
VAEKGYHHFVVVKGMRRRPRADRRSGRRHARTIARSSFETIWNNKLLVRRPPGADRGEIQYGGRLEQPRRARRWP